MKTPPPGPVAEVWLLSGKNATSALSASRLRPSTPVPNTGKPGLKRLNGLSHLSRANSGEKCGLDSCLDRDRARDLLPSIDTPHLVGLRDRSLPDTFAYTGAGIGAVARLRRGDLESWCLSRRCRVLPDSNRRSFSIFVGIHYKDTKNRYRFI